MLVVRSRLIPASTGEFGFTLVELLSVIALLAVLVAVAVPGYQIYMERARLSQTIAQLGAIDLAINEFAAANTGQFPANLGDVGFAGELDAWGGPIEYANLVLGDAPRVDQNGDPVNTAYDLYSRGRDGVTTLSLVAAASADDVVIASDGGFVGVVQDYARLP